jgi:dUTP pyrophosphatase
MKIYVKKTDPRAKAPAKANNDSSNAGYDLTAVVDEPIVLKHMDYRAIPTQIQMAIPDGCYGRIAPRSGLAVKHGIDVLAGVCDSSYRGNIMVALVNFGKEDFEVCNGMRIAQLIIEPCMHLEVVEVDELPTSSRMEAGFGSTGLY